MGLFTFAELSEIARQAIAAGLAPSREALLFGFPLDLSAALPGWGAGNPADALKLDLNELNGLDQPVGGEIPISMWLRNAHAKTSATRKNAADFFNEMALLAAQRAAQQAVPPGQPAVAKSTALQIPEKVLFRNDLLPDSFVALAAQRALSVARLSVYSYDGGGPRTLPSGNPDGVFGTGWLIGPRHLITNWHVITARSEGEAEPSAADIALQVANLKVEFDYTRTDAQIVPSAVAGLVHRNPALDYALLELTQPEPRAPLPLASTLPAISSEHPVAANIIQHPAGEPRQFGIRDNLVAVVQGSELAYFTDTAGGSSGSPVCDDQWRVIALHKASSAQFGDFSFQGKTTAWLNVGTIMPAIIADLTSAQPALWAAIGAKVV